MSPADALHELLDLAAVSRAVAGIRTDRAGAALATLWAQAFAPRVMALGCCRSDRSSRLRPLMTAVLVLLLFATTMGGGTGASHLGGPVLWG